MPLSPGSRLGLYEIETMLGAGGMGEVYRARDTKLGRIVAIKVLPDHLASDSDRIARLEREARALAALNHPRIATLYGLEHSEGRHMLVMERIEGETLDERLLRGPLSVDEALRLAIQIAEALEAAHQKGIVHRDLKPANVKLTPEGSIKVLDFGLAKAFENESAPASVSNSPTLSMMATQAGVILGTAAYMSPEQAKGVSVDHRSDIFSFGVVLYEMLAGRQPFRGETAPEILASVLVRDPDLQALAPNLNPRLPALLRRCLEKNPKSRWHAIGDVRAELDVIASAPTNVAAPAAPAPAAPLWKYGAVALATALVVGTLAWFAGSQLKPSPSIPIGRFSLTLPQDQRFTNPLRRLLAISNDGQRIVYVANRQVYVRPLSDLEASPLTNTEGKIVSNPVFSPDGQHVAFYSDGVLKRVPVNGGPQTTICRASTNPYGMSWESGTILFGDGAGGIKRVSETGGEPELLAAVEAPDVASAPQLLPDGRSLLFTLNVDYAGRRAAVVVQSLATGERKVIVDDATDGRFVASGHLVFVRGHTLFAAPFDSGELALSGNAVPVLEGVRRGQPTDLTGVAQFAVSASGSLVYIPGPTSSTERRFLTLLSPSGTAERLTATPGRYESPRFSPDGTWLAVGTDDGSEASIWVQNLSNASALRRLTVGGRNRHPTWSPDSKQITYQSDRDGDGGMFSQRADGTGAAQRLTKTEAGVTHIPESWSPDGRTLLFAVLQDGQYRLFTYSKEGGNIAPFGRVASVYPTSAAFSPDGRWVAYYERPPDRATGSTFVQPFPATGAQYEVSIGGGIHPFWWQDGTKLRLLYRFPQAVNSVEVTANPTFDFSAPTEVPFGNLFNPGPTAPRNLDVTATGNRFVTVAYPGPPQTDTAVETIHLTVNWFEELRTRVP